MKLVVSILALAIFFVPSQSHFSSSTNIAQSLYYRALIAVVTARAQDAKSALANDPVHHVIIMKDDQLNLGFPARLDDVEIEYLTSDDLRARHKSLKHEIPVFVMRPISNEGHRLIIDFTRYWFSATKKTDLMGLEGGYRVVMVYDCAQKEFVVESAKLWGI